MKTISWKIYKIGLTERWYDPHTRCWWVRKVDAEGNQVGDARDTYSKNVAVDFQRALARESAR